MTSLNSLTLHGVLVDSLIFSNMQLYHLHTVTEYNVYVSFFSLSCLIILTSNASTLCDNRADSILVLILILVGMPPLSMMLTSGLR